MKTKLFSSVISITIAAFFVVGCGIIPLAPNSDEEKTPELLWDESDNEKLTIKSKKRKIHPDPSQQRAKRQDELMLDTVSQLNLPLFLEISEWIGTPYSYGTNKKKIGTDCSGFTSEVVKIVYNIEISRIANLQAAEAKAIKKEELEAGDLLFFNIKGGKVDHVGIYLGNGKFVHASVKKGVIVNDLSENYYSEKYAGAGRVKK